SEASSMTGERVLTPAVSSHFFDQFVSSRPLVASNSTSRSFSSVLPQACFLKYCETPAKKASMPTHATSCLSTEPPLAYVMPSKLTWTSSRSLIVATIGCVDGSWSWRYAQAFSIEPNVVHASVHSVASAVASVDAHSANDSLSHRSFHQRIVTRSPNHMCASSWRIVTTRRSLTASVTLERNTYDSVKVTQPAFSIAPMLYSGTKSWSYLSNGYGCSNARS